MMATNPILGSSGTGRRIGLAAAALWALTLAPGCQGGMGSGDDLKALKDGQKQILERLEKIESAQKQILSSPIFARTQQPAIDYNKVYEIQIGDSPVRGATDAKVTLVEFSDMQCPYSQRAQPILQQLVEAFPTSLRHVYKNFPLSFHKQAMPAAKACVAAGMQGKFWEMHDLVYANPKELEDQHLKAYAQKIGLNMQRFEQDLQSDAVTRKIQADLEDAKKAEVRGTPTLFLNGKRVADRSLEGMKKQVETLTGASAKPS
ncbi:MAG: thioredoxin domain-containing protein [bacterium]